MNDIAIHKDPNPAPGSAALERDGSDLKKLESAVKRAKSIRDNWTGLWEDIYTYTFPGRRGFFEDRSVEGESRTDLIFDETALAETPRFVSRIVGAMFPPNNRAFTLKLHPSQARGEQKLMRELEDVTEAFHDGLRNSNFYSELHEGVTDLAIGTMTMNVKPGPFAFDYQTTAIPLTQLLLLPGPMGGPDVWIRQRELKLSEIKRVWPKAQLSSNMVMDAASDPDKTVMCNEAVFRRWDRSGEEQYEMIVGCDKYKAIVYREEYRGLGSNPDITARWSCEAGETYGRGVLVQCLPAIKTANLTVELILEAGQMAIGGTYAYDDDGIFNFDNVTIQPGTFIPKAPGSEITELGTHSRFDVSQLVLEEMRNNIRRCLFSSTPDRPQGKTPPSARELAEDRAETALNMGQAVTRLQYEFLIPLVRRLIFIEKQRGAIKIPQLDGRKVILVPESPLVRAQDFQEVSDYLQYTEALQFALGPASFGAHIPEELIPWLAQRHRVKPKLVPNGQMIQQRLQAVQQAAAQQQA